MVDRGQRDVSDVNILLAGRVCCFDRPCDLFCRLAPSELGAQLLGSWHTTCEPLTQIRNFAKLISERLLSTQRLSALVPVISTG